jgi:hypothetical protein
LAGRKSVASDDRKIAEVGWNRMNVALVVRAMGDGAFLGELTAAAANVVMRSENWYSPEERREAGGDRKWKIQTIRELTGVTSTAGRPTSAGSTAAN